MTMYHTCRQIVKVGDPQKIKVFLEFANDTDMLVASCRDEWLAIYDQEVMPFVCMVVGDTASMHVHPPNLHCVAVC